MNMTNGCDEGAGKALATPLRPGLSATVAGCCHLQLLQAALHQFYIPWKLCSVPTGRRCPEPMDLRLGLQAAQTQQCHHAAPHSISNSQGWTQPPMGCMQQVSEMGRRNPPTSPPEVALGPSPCTPWVSCCNRPQ